MIKLISAGCTRMWKDKIFWLTCAIMFIYGVLMLVKTNPNMPLEAIFFTFAVIIGIPIAAFCGMFIGTEHSDGTIRNKLIVGHSRCAVYLSNLIVNFIACILIAFSYTVAMIVIGVPRLGFFEVSIGHILLYSFAAIMMIFALAAIYTLLCLLITNKATAAVICVLVSFALFFFSVRINSKLKEIKYSEGNMNITTTIESLEMSGNDKKISKKDLYQFLYDFVPNCQGMQIGMQNSNNLWMLPIYSASIIVVTSGLGIFLFRKKDLK